VNPRLSSDLAAASDILGTRLRLAILESLAQQGPASRSELSRRLEVSVDSLRLHLTLLEDEDVVTVKPPRNEPGRLLRRYSINPVRIREVLDALNRTLRP
jgi:DNA-binding transcriptional ArsR family regulator